MYWVYIIENQVGNKFYVGSTDDVQRRLAEHNSRKKGCYSTRQKGKWQLVYKHPFETKEEARIREQVIKKKKSRFYIESLIKKQG